MKAEPERKTWPSNSYLGEDFALETPTLSRHLVEATYMDFFLGKFSKAFIKGKIGITYLTYNLIPSFLFLPPDFFKVHEC